MKGKLIRTYIKWEHTQSEAQRSVCLSIHAGTCMGGFALLHTEYENLPVITNNIFLLPGHICISTQSLICCPVQYMQSAHLTNKSLLDVLIVLVNKQSMAK